MKVIKSEGVEPDWDELTKSYPELKYIFSDDLSPLNIANIVREEISLYK